MTKRESTNGGFLMQRSRLVTLDGGPLTLRSLLVTSAEAALTHGGFLTHCGAASAK